MSPVCLGTLFRGKALLAFGEWKSRARSPQEFRILLSRGWPPRSAARASPGAGGPGPTLPSVSSGLFDRDRSVASQKILANRATGNTLLTTTQGDSCPSLKFEIVDIARTASRSTTRPHGRPSLPSQGYIDWFLKSPLQDGSLLTSIKKETHLSYTLGFKISPQSPPRPARSSRKHTRVTRWRATVVLKGYGETKDGNLCVRNHGTSGPMPPSAATSGAS